jgi:hypothetical protein
MPVEQRGQVIAVEHGPTGSNREEPEGSAGRRQPSRGDTSRMNREVQVRICEGLGAKLPGPTRQGRPASFASTLKVQRSAVGSGSGRPGRVWPMSQLGRNYWFWIEGGKVRNRRVSPVAARPAEGPLSKSHSEHSPGAAGTGLHAPKWTLCALGCGRASAARRGARGNSVFNR